MGAALLPPLLLPLLRASLLGSELLLAATHAKVLCCVGAPYPEVYLSAQRYRYFVWDLVSVQAAFWATDPGGLQRLLARSSSASSASDGAVAASGDPHTSSRTRPGTKPAGNGSCSATAAAHAPARMSKERESLAAAAPATGDMLCCGCADASCHDNLSNGTPGWNTSGSGHSTNVTAVTSAGLCTADPVAWHLHVHQQPVARGSSAWRSSAAVSSLLQQLWARLWQLHLRGYRGLAAAGHAALHVFYIAVWNQPHARRVVSMSAVVSPRERLHRFPLGQVAWYCAGTAFDIGTHLLLAAALGRALLLPRPPGAPQHDQP